MSKKESAVLDTLDEPSFSNVPSDRRQSPGRVKSVPLRFYTAYYKEHKQALEFISKAQKLNPGSGTRTIVRALLTYKDQIIGPAATAKRNKDGSLPKEYRIAETEFEKVPKASKNKAKQISLKLAIDKWVEHRNAYNFLQKMQQLHGEGNKTIVRSLIYYEENIFLPELKKLEVKKPKKKNTKAIGRARSSGGKK